MHLRRGRHRRKEAISLKRSDALIHHLVTEVGPRASPSRRPASGCYLPKVKILAMTSPLRYASASQRRAQTVAGGEAGPFRRQQRKGSPLRPAENGTTTHNSTDMVTRRTAAVEIGCKGFEGDLRLGCCLLQHNATN
eukprot:RCo029234